MGRRFDRSYFPRFIPSLQLSLTVKVSHKRHAFSCKQAIKINFWLFQLENLGSLLVVSVHILPQLFCNMLCLGDREKQRETARDCKGFDSKCFWEATSLILHCLPSLQPLVEISGMYSQTMLFYQVSLIVCLIISCIPCCNHDSSSLFSSIVDHSS